MIPHVGLVLYCLNLPRFSAKRMYASVFMGRRSTSPPTTSAVSICSCTTLTTTILILPTATPSLTPTTGMMNRLMPLSPIPHIQPSGRAKTIRFSSMTHDSHPQPCLPQKARPILPLPCTCSPGSLPLGRRQLLSFPVCCTVVVPNRKFVNI